MIFISFFYRAKRELAKGTGLVLFMTISLVSQAQNELFLPIDESRRATLPAAINDLVSPSVFELDLQILEQIRADETPSFTLNIPHSTGDLHLELEVVDIFSNEFEIQWSEDAAIRNLDLGLHLRGSLIGNEHSIVAISLYDNQVKGLIVSPRGTYELGPLSNTDYHIIYRVQDAPVGSRVTSATSCSMEDDGFGVYDHQQLNHQSRAPGDPVDIYIEVDYDLYDEEGASPPAMISYVTALFNESAAIFEAESVEIRLSQIFVWVSPDPYDGVNVGPGAARMYLQDFQDALDGFNGDLGVLLLKQDIGGVAGGFDGLCNPDPDKSLCVAGRSEPDLYPFPEYSYNIQNFSHELGHLLGSRHTHACVWNGNDTAIDGCAGSTEGDCPLPPNPEPGEATIMSYCQDELSAGFVASSPFGPQPGAVIRSSVASAGCLVCPAEELIYLPDVHGSGPAITLCESEPAPPGYTEAPSQYCALAIIETFPECSSISWGGFCHMAYEGCWEPGCMDPMACNYDPESNIDDGSCEYPECIDCNVYHFAPVDLTKSFDPVQGVRDRVQVKWFKDFPQVRYSDEDAAMCDIKFWEKRNLDPITGIPFGPVIIDPDTVLIENAKKEFGDGSPREIFKWPIKFRADGVNNSKRAEPNKRYEWKVRCECGHDGNGPESPWSAVKVFNTPDFDPISGIYTPPGDLVGKSLGSDIASNYDLYPNPNDGDFVNIVFHGESTDVLFEFIDIRGRVMLSERVQMDSKSIHRMNLNTASMTSGMYLLRIIEGEKVEHIRFYVN